MQVRKNPKKYLLKTAILTIWLTTICTQIFASQTAFKNHNSSGAKSRIIASFYEQNNQQKLIAGFEIILQEGWKIYAPDTSGFGIAPSFNLANSQNINTTNFNPIFPSSIVETEQIMDETIKYNIYKEKVIIPIELQTINPNKNNILNITINYGLCKDICIPAQQQFSLNIKPQESDTKTLQNIQQFLPHKQIAPNPITTTNKTPQATIKISLFKILLIAFIGGAILNIMPCVLPVLSLKLLSIINHSGAKQKRIRLTFLSTTSGIVFSFLVFASVATFLKSAGNVVGWGFQFQNSYFLLFLLIILMGFIANLLGLFEVNLGNSLGSIINKKITNKEEKNNIFIPNFLSGILAVLLATPCSAPFVGVAISFALSANIKEIFLIFTTMSLGLALPYLLLIAFPKSIRFLPRSGNWMIKTKQLMAGLLAATAIWIIYILIGIIGFIPSISAAILALLILPFFKITKQINLIATPKSPKQIILATIIFTTLITSIFIIPNYLSLSAKITKKNQQQNWIKFNEPKISQLIKEGKTVLVDITADWCITCKANKILVLNSHEIKDKLKDPNIIGMRGDLTNPNQKIFDFMQKYHRYGIPLNIIFGPNAPDGIITSELLSKKEVLEAIDKASESNK